VRYIVSSGSAPPSVSTDSQSVPNRPQSNQTAVRRQPSLGAVSSRNNDSVVTSSLLMDCESGVSPMGSVAWSANPRLGVQNSEVIVEQPSSVTSRPVNPFQGVSSASTSSVTSPSPAALARFSGLPLQTRPNFSSTGRTAFPFDVDEQLTSSKTVAPSVVESSSSDAPISGVCAQHSPLTATH
jgi:hypothetical protein